MPVQTDNIGMFIKGMAQPDELIKYIQARFSEQEIEETYARMSETAKSLAKDEKITPLQAFWKLLDQAYREKAPPLQCGEGCAHCCYTGVALTQMEWDGILNLVQEKGIDLEAVIERSQKTIRKVREVLKSNKNLDQVDWHNLVINQPCPFLGEDQACTIYEDRPLDCRLVVAFRGVCESKKLEHAQRGVVVEEAVGSTVVAKLQHDQTPKFRRRKFNGTQPLRLFQHWLILWQDKKSKKKKR
ncbi:MAG: YkgJ family cysteine cluster protein [Nitrospinae bacterium]|jgi:Fe-S-cluster containining protein|nr:YkgJ family cysteine cluster protein [Nitrospinota bacterium]MDA1108768.1 YkgJ family cysteine cluster protein [Nitrospinota bacterium]